VDPINAAERSQLNGHAGVVLWFTGFSGSGKSTIANALEYRLFHELHAHTYLLDGDILRTGLNQDLDFSDAGRKENIRRVGHISHLFYDAGLIVLTTFISPFRADRAFVRSLLPQDAFVEIYVHCPLEVCEQRDPKGLYKKARKGLIPHFTGIDSPYEPPENPEIILNSAAASLHECTSTVIDYLQRKQITR
jgi:adenylylsulfate kinase